MLTKEYIVMLLIEMDLAFIQPYVHYIWFVQRNLRNLLTTYLLPRRNTHEEPRHPHFRRRPRRSRFQRFLDVLGNDRQPHQRREDFGCSPGRCEDAVPAVQSWKRLRHRLISRKYLHKIENS